MAVIERLLENVERDQERDREEADWLRRRIAQLEADLQARDATIATRDATIADLRRMVDQLLGQPRQGPPPPTAWPDPGPGRSPGN